MFIIAYSQTNASSVINSFPWLMGKSNIFNISYLANEHKSNVLLILTLGINAMESMTMRPKRHTCSRGSTQHINSNMTEGNGALKSVLILLKILKITARCQVLYTQIISCNTC